MTRTRTLDDDIDFQLSPLDLDMNATVTVTDNSGNAVADQDVELRYEVDEDVRTFTTDSYGQFVADLNSGNSADTSEGGSEYGSHGIIAWISGSSPQIGVSTLITGGICNQIYGMNILGGDECRYSNLRR
jgi:hypothetical protein